MARKTNSQKPKNVALCYIRLSFTRDDDDTNSPDRQRSNIQAVCDKNGWIPEWYEDVGGHRSGRSEKNRPAWLSLKQRLDDPDVVALVANDLSRLHRKGWRIGDLIEYVNERNLYLMLAAPGREIDTTTVKGRMFLQFGAIIDEYYAEDISQRAKDSVAYRKGRGISVGMPPFGTVRDGNGHLIPSPEGAWLLPNGRFAAGIKDEAPPEEGALWRGYYEAAHYILTLYSQGKLGREKISYRLNEEGWAYRDRKGQPRMVERDDIRQVISNFPEYGGIVNGTKAKQRPAYAQANTEDYAFIPERAVFPIELLKSVAAIRKDRGIKPIDNKVKRESFPYALSGLAFCFHCEKLSRDQVKPKLRSHLTGNKKSSGVRRYTHKPGIKCGCTNRSVTCELLENEFGRLIDLLTIRDESKDLLLELALRVDKRVVSNDQALSLDEEKQQGIALCRRRIEAAVNLYKDGTIDRKEYLHIRETNEREMAHWESRTTQTEEIALELAMCVEAVQRLSRLWKIASSEDRQGLARSLFEEVIFDLDQQQIVEFKLKAWADRYLVLRHAMHEIEAIEVGQQKTPPQGEGNHVTHREFESLFWP